MIASQSDQIQVGSLSSSYLFYIFFDSWNQETVTFYVTKFFDKSEMHSFLILGKGLGIMLELTGW